MHLPEDMRRWLRERLERVLRARMELAHAQPPLAVDRMDYWLRGSGNERSAKGFVRPQVWVSGS